MIFEGLIVSLIQFTGKGFTFSGIMGNIYADATTLNGASRIGGTLVSANTAGSFFSLLITPAFSILMTGMKRMYKRVALIAFACGTIGLILTGSRGAWLATFISFLIFGAVAIRKGWLSSRIVIAGVVIILLITVLFYSPVYDRIFGYDAGAAASRIPQYEVALQIIQDHPILGVGANNYPNVQRRYAGLDPDNKLFMWAVHNKYLLVFAESGFFGLLFFVSFLASKIRLGFRIANSKDTLLSPLALGFASAIIGQMAHMFLDVFHGRPQVQLLWLIAGLLLAMSFIRDFDVKNATTAVECTGKANFQE
jgi:O-antigen ligase